MLKNSLAGLLTIVAIGGMVQAQTIYNDGGTHTINGPSGPIEVLNGTTVNLDAQATITGGFIPGPGGFTATVFGDTSSTINLNGAQVTAPQAPGSPSGNISGIGILSEGPFTATGGFSQGGPGDTSQRGGWALLANNSVQISGGTFQGGNGAFGGDAAILSASTSVTDTISGGTFQGGNASGPNGPGLALVLQLVAGTSTASITGGTFLGSLLYQGEYAGPGGSEFDISGGIFSESIGFALYTPRDTMNFFGNGFRVQNIGGTEWFSGTLADNTTINVPIYANFPYSTEVTSLPGGEEFSFIGVTVTAPEPSSLLTLALGIGGASLGLLRARLRALRRQPLEGERESVRIFRYQPDAGPPFS